MPESKKPIGLSFFFNVENAFVSLELEANVHIQIATNIKKGVNSDAFYIKSGK
jgi:hypothetical protein